MHAPDLSPMRQKLFEFMSGWLGGPPLYFERPDHACIVSAHRPFAIGAQERDQWLAAMDRALHETNLDVRTRELVSQALRRMAEAFRNR
jgi:hemoglobin